ncbi:hypothetical protein B0H11DRAFT_2262020 [Mycena galericulata]|nr:hypothetical protein B0H11DRAFT_2262020 [Mycena galericulata]
MPPNIPADVLFEILHFCSQHDIAQVATCSKLSHDVAQPILYRDIAVSIYRAPKVLRPVAASPDLGKLVRVLRLLGHQYDHQLIPIFEEAISRMPGLVELEIHTSVDCEALVRGCCASLRVFTFYPSVNDAIYKFLDIQTSITKVTLGHLNRSAPTPNHRPNILPLLTHVQAPARDLVELVPSRPVRYVKFLYTDREMKAREAIPLTFLQHAHVVRLELAGFHLSKPIDLETLLPHLTHLVIMQDPSWGKRYSARDWQWTLGELAHVVSALEQLSELVFITTFARKFALRLRKDFEDHAIPFTCRLFVVHNDKTCFRWPDPLSSSVRLESPVEKCLSHFHPTQFVPLISTKSN